MNETPLDPNPSESPGNTRRVLLSVGIIVALAAIAFVVWAYTSNEHMTSQAQNIAKAFITSSPRVETNLGKVVSVKEKNEARINGPLSGWKLDYKVVGQRSTGDVIMVLQNVNGRWNVPSAELRDSAGKVNLM
jgi:hypothetical protein